MNSMNVTVNGVTYRATAVTYTTPTEGTRTYLHLVGPNREVLEIICD